MNRRILCVDDDPNVLAGIQRNLRKRFDIETTSSAAEALILLEKQGPYAVILADMQMPEMNGVQLLGHARRIAPDSIRIMLTGNSDRDTPIDAVNGGHIFRFLNKPCPPEELATALDAGLDQFRLITAERELLESTLNGSIKVLTDVLAAIDPESFGRAQQLRQRVQQYAAFEQLPGKWELELGAMLAPIGYIAIPATVTQKAREGSSLNSNEMEMVARVPEVGAKLLSNIPRLEGVANIIHYQRKNFDGSGFPSDDVAGDAIPLGARLLKIIGDMLDLISLRVPEREAILRIQKYPGLYDPRILETMLARLAKENPVVDIPPSVRAIKARDLEIGLTLAGDIRTLQNVLLIASGNRITPVLLERIRNFAQIGGISEPILVRD
jgi:response regulator RpfG family c-di-GMP phosphodiesterase